MTPITPEPILKTLSGLFAVKYLLVAGELGLFAALAPGPASLADLSARLAVPVRTLRIVADALVATGFLCTSAGGYENTPVTAAFLAGAPGPDLRPILRLWERVVYPQWASLEESIRHDRRTLGYPDFTPAQQAVFSEGVGALTLGAARALSTAYDFGRHRSMLDLGGGTGEFLFSARRNNPSLALSLFELPKTAAAVRSALAKAPGGADIAITEGDFFVDPIPEGHDVFLIAKVAHLHLPENNITLLRHIRAAAPVGARVLLIDFWTNTARTEPVFAALIAAEFQIVTGEGDVYAVETAFEWLKEAGFRLVGHQPLSGAASLIIGEAI